MATTKTTGVLQEVAIERERQDEKWGEQNHPNGTGAPVWRAMARSLQDQYAAKAEAGSVDWLSILLEEVYEALAEGNPGRLREELVQTAAVCVAWVEKIDRDEAKVPPLDMLAATLAEAGDEEFAEFADVVKNGYRERAQRLLSRMGAAIPTGGN